jgi:hypothetical protein
MANTTTLNETTRVLDGTESVRLATSGANWKALVSAVATYVNSQPMPVIAGGTAAGSTLTLESTSGAGTSDAIIFKTASQAERMRINTGGQVLINETAAQVVACQVGISANTNNNDALELVGYGGFATNLDIGNTVAATNTPTGGALTSGTTMHNYNMYGSDGTAYRQSAAITCTCDATPATSTVAGRIGLWTTPAGSSQTPIEALRMDSAGAIYFPRVTTAAASTAISVNTGSTPANKLIVNSSSLRFKKDVTKLPRARIDAIADLEPIEYASSVSDDDQETRFVGFAAEEVAKLDPSLVSWGYDASDYEVKDVGSDIRPRREFVLKPGSKLKPHWVMYDRVLLLKVAALEAEIADLRRHLS